MLYTYYQKQTSGNNLSPRILVITELQWNPQQGVLTSWQAFVQFYFPTWTLNFQAKLDNFPVPWQVASHRLQCFWNLSGQNYS